MSSARKLARRRAGQVQEARAAARTAQDALALRERQDQAMRDMQARAMRSILDVREVSTRYAPSLPYTATLTDDQLLRHAQNVHEAQAREIGLTLLREGLITVSQGSGLDGPWTRYAVRVIAPPTMPEYATVRMVHP